MPLRNASALDVVALLNRLLADPGAGGPGPIDAQQRVTIMADSRSNSVLVRADNPGRLARVRQLIEQLDTPGRPGGNMFIVYLKNAEAARVAQTLRAMLSGTDSGGASGGSTLPSAPPLFLGNAPMAGAVPAAAAARRSRAPCCRSTTSFSANGATITADLASNALIIMAPEPVYNNLRAIIEKLDVRRAQVFVEALIVEVSADKAAEFGIQWQALSGYNSTQTRVIGGTNFTPRGSGNNIIDVAVNPGSVGQGLALGVMKGTVTIPGLGTITNLGFSRPRARDADRRQHPVDADAAHARQRGGAHHRRPEHPAHHRQLRDDGRHEHGDAVPDVRAQGRRHRPSRQAADHRRRHDPSRALPGGVAGRGRDHRRAASSCRSARSNRRWSSTTRRSSCWAA